MKSLVLDKLRTKVKKSCRFLNPNIFLLKSKTSQLIFFQYRMDLQDALRSSGWNVTQAIEKMRSDMQSINKPEKKKSLLPKKTSMIIYLNETHIIS